MRFGVDKPPRGVEWGVGARFVLAKIRIHFFTPEWKKRLLKLFLNIKANIF